MLSQAQIMSIPTCNGGSLLRVEAFDTARFLPILTGLFAFLWADVEVYSALFTVASVFRAVLGSE